MARDDHSTMPRPAGPPRSAAKKRGLNPMFLGIIIGLLLGIGLALALAIWLNRANNPFVEKSRPVEALQTLPSKSLAPPVVTAKADPDKPRFEFYQILPGEKGGKGESSSAPRSLEAAAKPAPESRQSVKVEPKSEARVEPRIDIKPASGEVFFLQAGAFQSQTDAENMKAKVAFAGFEAAVRSVNLPEKGTLYRVRLGPYKSQDEVNRIKSALSQGGIGAVVVKGSD